MSTARTSRPDPLHVALVDAVKAAQAAGISVVPPKEDGTKRPDGTWKRYQSRPATTPQLRAWYGPRTGVGFVCGSASGGLELLELDEDFYPEFKATAEAVGLGPLLARVEAGYLERSPGGGWHLLYRCPELRGNTKLASKPGAKAGKVDVLIETRGQGGFVVVAPSYGRVHPSGKPYQLLKGGPATIADISEAERDALWSLAKTFDCMPPPAEPTPAPSKARGASGEVRPGDDFNARESWTDLLQSYGWKLCHTRGDTGYWRRPGKDQGWSATTNHGGSGLLWMFTSSTGFEQGKSYTKFGAYAILGHGGDHASAAKALALQGYGQQKPGSKARSGHASTGHTPTTTNRMIGDSSGEIGRHRERSGDTEVSRSLPNPTMSPKSPDADRWRALSDEDFGLLDLSTVTAKEVTWLLRNRIPMGMFTLFAGEGGLGKTFALLSIAAGISKGGKAPDGESYPLGDTIILTAEDDPSYAIKPRLNAMKADPKRVAVLGTARLPDGHRAPISLADLDRLEDAIRRRPETKMIFVDPIPSFLGRGIDDAKNTDVRLILEPLADFAAKHQIALVGVTHFNKSPNAKAVHRVMGSVAYSNVARATWCLVEDPEQEGRRLMLPVKNNYSPVRNNGLAFTIADGAVVWEDEAVTTPLNEVLAVSSATGSAARRGKAVEFLKDLLTGKFMPGDDVIAKAGKKGFGKNLVWEVKAEAGVRNQKEGFSGRWLWTIDPAPESKPKADAEEIDFGPPPTNGQAVARIADEDRTKRP